MIRVQYDGVSFPVCKAGEVEVWCLGGGIYVGVLLQDRVKALAGKRVRARALTDVERGQLELHRRQTADLCGQGAALATVREHDPIDDAERAMRQVLVFLDEIGPTPPTTVALKQVKRDLSTALIGLTTRRATAGARR